MATRQTFSVQFYCRASKADKKGFAPVELSLVINGKRTYLKLQRKERPEDFQKAMSSKRDNDIKLFCENQRIRVNAIVEDMQFADIELTAESLKECLMRGSVTNFYTLGQLFSDLIDAKRSEMKLKDIEYDTFRRYNIAKDEFYIANSFNDNTPAKSVELMHVITFQNRLRESGKEQSTIYNYHYRVRCAFALAFSRGKIKANPYAGFKLKKGEKDEIVYLNDSELEILKNKQLIGRLDRIRDLFLFQCYSGLAYSDMAMLEKEDYQFNQSGQVFIQKRRKKTGKMFTSIVLKDGIEVLKKYDYELPVLSNTKYNAYLKEVQTLCGLDKSLHTHLGRTSYICYLYRNKVPISMIASIVGHSSCETTIKYYARMDENAMLEEFAARCLDSEERAAKKMDKDYSRASYQRRKAKREKEREDSIEKMSTVGIQLDDNN